LNGKGFIGIILRYVFALGGNAFTARNLEIVSRFIVPLCLKGNEIVITHGNGPQVGRLYLKEGRSLATLTGETEKVLGSEIRKAILGRLRKAKVSVVLTRTLVSGRDPEFRRPTKPIGGFYQSKEAVPRGKRGFGIRRLEGGYRLVVPSPRPLRIFETGKIERLLSHGHVVIAAGGGGMAVVKSKAGTRLADAVLDKDLVSSLLAWKIMADGFFILTNVEGAYTDFGKRDQRLVRMVSASALRRYLRQGHFEEGSMKPKVEACLEFVGRRRKIAAIGSISKIKDVFGLKATVVLP